METGFLSFFVVKLKQIHIDKGITAGYSRTPDNRRNTRPAVRTDIGPEAQNSHPDVRTD